MSADLLREAAALARERVEAAPDQTVTDKRVTGVWLNSAYYLTTRPDVEAAVAVWLMAEAESHVHLKGEEPTFTYDLPGMDDSPAVRFARAYLATP